MRMYNYFLYYFLQPIYLNLRLHHGAGNHDNIPSVACVVKRTLHKVISINGEEVEVSSVNDINIHDFATFELEEHVADKFMNTIKRKSSLLSAGEVSVKSLQTKTSFKSIARDICRVENVLKALKHYSHRSDSEPESDEDSDTDSQRTNSTNPDHITIHTENNNLPHVLNTNEMDLSRPAHKTSSKTYDSLASDLPTLTESDCIDSSPDTSSPTHHTSSPDHTSPSKSSTVEADQQLSPPKRGLLRPQPPSRRVSQMNSTKDSSLCSCCVLL